MARISWKYVRFVGEFKGRTVDSPIAHGDPSWVKRLLALLANERLPDTVAPCTPIPEPDGDRVANRMQYVVPSQIDWTGYRHAGGDPTRRARSGPSGPTKPESERDRAQVKLSLSDSDAAALRGLAQRRGVGVSELVAELVRGADDRESEIAQAEAETELATARARAAARKR
jgi:hypothetical protein